MGKYRFVKSTIRSLKRQYGQSVTLYKTTANGTITWSSGTIADRTTSTKVINKAVILPGVGSRQKTPFDGQYDRTKREIILDRDDIGTFGFDMDTTIRFGGSDYKIVEFDNYEEANAYYVTCMKLEGQINES